MSTPTFNELVQKLTGEYHEYINTDDGLKLVSSNGLLEQLRRPFSLHEMRPLSACSCRIRSAPGVRSTLNRGLTPHQIGLDRRAAMQSIEWRPVVGYEGFYEVSDQGQVRSLDHRVPCRVGTRLSPGRIRKTKQNRDGYLQVSLCRDGVTRHFDVHRLVLLAFVGAPNADQEGCHINGDPSDARLVNLRWDTHGMNMRDAISQGTHFMASKTACKRGHRFTDENTHVMPAGGRVCRECGRRRNRAKVEARA